MFWYYPCRHSPPPPPPLNNFYNKGNIYPKNKQVEINNYNITQIFILASVVSSLLWLSFLQLCHHVKYVTFNTDLCTRRMAIIKKLPDGFWSFFHLLCWGFPGVNVRITITNIYYFYKSQLRKCS